jgi:hypothetical protein
LVTLSHVMSHWQLFEQVKLPHAPSVPWQFAVALPVPALTEPHASAPPEQVSAQVPLLHVMLPHAALPLQLRLQLPDAHVRVPHTARPPPPLHVSVQFALP